MSAGSLDRPPTHRPSTAIQALERAVASRAPAVHFVFAFGRVLPHNYSHRYDRAQEEPAKGISAGGADTSYRGYGRGREESRAAHTPDEIHGVVRGGVP